MSWGKTFAHGIAISLDYALQLALFWRLGTPMTVSSRAGLALRSSQRTGALVLLGRFLNWIDPGHTEAAIAADIARAQAALAALGTH